LCFFKSNHKLRIVVLDRPRKHRNAKVMHTT
jgi:hypothetical protein